MRRTENSSGKAFITDGLPPGGTCRRHAPEFRRGRSVPNSQKHRTTTPTVEPSRLRLILERLQSRFYDDAPASERIAAAVLADVKDLDESPPALPH
jgi:hypothetical protein